MRMPRKFPFHVAVALASAAFPLFALTPITLESKLQSTEASVASRLFLVNPSVPDCSEKASVRLDIAGAVEGVPSVAVSASIDVILGPSVGINSVSADPRVSNLIQTFSGSLTTGRESKRLAWFVRRNNGGPFTSHVLFAGNSLKFLLPARFESQEVRGVAPVFAFWSSTVR